MSFVCTAGLLILYLLVQVTAVPSGFLCTVKPTCSADKNSPAEIEVISDLELQSTVECKDGFRLDLVTTDSAHYTGLVKYQGNSNTECVFKTIGNSDIYHVTIAITTKNQGSSLDFKSERYRITCTYGEMADVNTGVSQITQSLEPPDEIHQHGSGDVISSLKLNVEDVLGNTLTESIPPDKKIRLVATMYNEVEEAIDNFNCDFTDDWCGFTQDETDNFDWLRVQGPSNSSTTGPTGDYTDGEGFYLLMASSIDRKYGAKARLVSPDVKVNGDGLCLTFYVTMYGAGVNALLVYAKTGNSLGNPIWKREKNQGRGWFRGQTSISGSGTVNVVFEAVHGYGKDGDITIDSCVLSYGLCTDEADFTCDFNDGMCGFTDDTSDDFNWGRIQGKSNEQLAGPIGDHTSGDGHFLFIDTSNGVNEDARLFSPEFQINSGEQRCVRVFLYLFGDDSKNLRIYGKYKSNPRRRHRRSRIIDSGSYWFEERFTLTEVGEFQLTFRAVLNSADDGNMAIDDFSIRDGACNEGQSFNCDFSSDLCGYTQDSSDDFDWSRVNGQQSPGSTGPEDDHTDGYGYYVYIPNEAGRQSGDSASLVSPAITLSAGEQLCIGFFVMLNGQDVDRINVYSSLNSVRTLQWSRKKNHGTNWSEGQFTISGPGSFNVVFEGVWGSSENSEIALDDISYTPGSCTEGNNLTCTFDDDMCGFTQDTTDDDFDWIRLQGESLTTSTGPRGDHTNGEGYYLNILTDSPRKRGDKARVLSPDIELESNQQMCVHFFAHMYGADVEASRVYVRRNNEADELVWTRRKSQGQDWLPGEFSITGPGPLNIIFEGIVGFGPDGRIAIDDYSLTDGACSDGNLLTCDFSEDFCGFTQNSGDGFDWERTSGVAPLRYTGPSTDNTDGAGYFMYIETATPRTQNEAALLVSPEIQLSAGKEKCVSFYANMFGSHVNELIVYTRRGSGDSQSLLRAKDHGASWFEEQVTVAGPGPLNIVFEGKVGSGEYGNIAIDDYRIKDNACNDGDELTCDFSADLCDFTQDATDDFDWIRLSGSAPTTNTGPEGDHTDGNGHYLYIETASPRAEGDVSRILSPVINMAADSEACVTFYTHMFGSNVANLNVYTSNDNTLGTLKWTRQDDQGKTWFRVSLSISGPGPVKIDWEVKATEDTNSSMACDLTTAFAEVIFEGTVGGGEDGNIAIDDYSVKLTPCRVPTSETIESYTNEVSAQISGCSAVGDQETYQFLLGGCGDGIFLDRASGFTTSGKTINSPFFNPIFLRNSVAIHYQCNFTVCSENCDGSSCASDKRRRRSPENIPWNTVETGDYVMAGNSSVSNEPTRSTNSGSDDKSFNDLSNIVKLHGKGTSKVLLIPKSGVCPKESGHGYTLSSSTGRLDKWCDYLSGTSYWTVLGLFGLVLVWIVILSVLVEAWMRCQNQCAVTNCKRDQSLSFEI